MPFSTAFLVGNLSIKLDDLPVIYVVTGVFALFMGPIAGKLADTIGKFVVFAGGSALGCVLVIVWAHLSGPTALWLVIVINVFMFAAITARMISAGALTSAVPAMPDRGAFMSINSSLQQVSGGIAAYIGGLIVAVQPDGSILHFDRLGWVVVAAMIVTPLSSVAAAVSCTSCGNTWLSATIKSRRRIGSNPIRRKVTS